MPYFPPAPTLSGLQLADADLDAIAALPTQPWGRDWLTLASDSAARTALSLVPGTHVQVHDSDLAALAGLATTGLIDRTGSGTATTRTTGTTGLNVLAAADEAAARTAIGTEAAPTYGTWSPTYVLSTSGSVTMGADTTGAWVRFGKYVYVEAYLFTAGVSSPVGNVGIPLPFAAAYPLRSTAFAVASQHNWASGITFRAQVNPANGSQLRLSSHSSANSGYTFVTAAHLDGTANKNYLVVSGFYQVDP